MMEVIAIVVGTAIAFGFFIDAFGYLVDDDWRRGNSLISHLTEPYRRMCTRIKR